MELSLSSGWLNNVQTVDAMGDFDRWPEVAEVLVDVMVSESFAGGWGQLILIFQSGSAVEGAPNVNDWEQLAEMGISDATTDWKTLVWEVDMSQHKGAFEQEGGWFIVRLNTNNDPSDEAKLVFVDNFRVSVPVTTSVSDWSLF